MKDKILATHLERRATVYLRQSTLRQVHEHRESTARQYGLQQRALDLGWSSDRIEVVDEDLGQSGSSAERRTGFQRLAEDVAHGRIGAIFALEVSRLSRSSADWYRLLDLCGLADVVLVDEQVVYTPRDYNDRLLLGLKGQMSEAEQYWMRLRLEGGRLSKARRGELHLASPAGYEWDPAARRFRLDPDERVQRAIRLVFDRFRLDGSAYAVLRYLKRQSLVMPARDQLNGGILWVPARYHLVLGILQHPIYAGAYVFGRSEGRRCLVDGQVRRRRETKSTPEAWKTCLRERHPGYIQWEDFMANQRKLEQNRTDLKSPHRRGAAREGEALLQGLVLCGKCGRRMVVKYRSSRQTEYRCRPNAEGENCWMVPARPIDEAVSRLFLETVQPPEIDLALAVVREVESQAQDADRQWALRLERVRYEAQLAERRYKAVDPENRVVARTLEREWNERLCEIEDLEREREEVRRREKLELTPEDRASILSLAKDLPAVWNAQTTTSAERKNLLRMLVREVTLSPVEVPKRMTRVQLLWQTGAVNDFTVPRRDKYRAQETPAKAVAFIRDFVKRKRSDSEIAAELNAKGLRTGVGRAWEAEAVRSVRHQHGFHRPSPGPQPTPDRRADGLYSARGVAKLYGVSPGIVRYWAEKGWIERIEGSPGRAQWFRLDDAAAARLDDLKARGYGIFGRHPPRT